MPSWKGAWLASPCNVCVIGVLVSDEGNVATKKRAACLWLYQNSIRKFVPPRGLVRGYEVCKFHFVKNMQLFPICSIPAPEYDSSEIGYWDSAMIRYNCRVNFQSHKLMYTLVLVFVIFFTIFSCINAVLWIFQNVIHEWVSNRLVLTAQSHIKPALKQHFFGA